MSRAGIACVLWLLVGTVGCSSENDGAEGTKLDGLIHSFVVDENNAIVSGVEICVVGRPDIPCVTTGTDGVGDLAVPLNQEMVVSYEKDGFITNRRQLFSSADLGKGLGTWIFRSKAWYDTESSKLGGAFDFSKGFIGLQSGFFADVTFDVEPKLVKEFKFTLVGAKIELCIVESECELGFVGFGDVPPGTYRAYIHQPGKSCAQKAFACADGTPECTEVEVVAGEMTHASVTCE